MKKKKCSKHKKEGIKNYKHKIGYDEDLPEAPRLEIYQETFGGFTDITDEWYKENEG